MTPAELKTLIESDATASALLAAGNDNDCAARLVVIAPLVQQLVANVDIKRQAILSGYWAGITIATEAANTNAAVRGLAISVGAWVNDTTATTDFALPQVQAMLDGLVASTLITADQRAELTALSMVPQVITSNDVSAVRAI